MERVQRREELENVKFQQSRAMQEIGKRAEEEEEERRKEKSFAKERSLLGLDQLTLAGVGGREGGRVSACLSIHGKSNVLKCINDAEDAAHALERGMCVSR